MGLKVDKFTWIVIGVVAALLVAAIATVNLSGGDGWDAAEYLVEDSPAASVYNAFIALQKGDLFTAREQYSKRVLAEIDEQRGYDPFSSSSYEHNQVSRRLRIVESEISSTDANEAQVTFVQDNYSRRGLFEGSSNWSRGATVRVIREDGRWKIDAQEFFY